MSNNTRESLLEVKVEQLGFATQKIIAGNKRLLSTRTHGERWMNGGREHSVVEVKNVVYREVNKEFRVSGRGTLTAFGEREASMVDGVGLLQ